MKTYKFSNSKVIKEIQLIFGEYDNRDDCSTNTIKILFCDNTEISWQSTVINGGDIAVSENGNCIYAEIALGEFIALNPKQESNDGTIDI